MIIPRSGTWNSRVTFVINATELLQRTKIWRGFPLFVALKNGRSTVTYTGRCILSCQSFLSLCFRAVALFQGLHFPLTHMHQMLSSSCPPLSLSIYISRHNLNLPHNNLTDYSNNCQSAANSHLPCNLFCHTINTTIWLELLVQYLICCRLWEGAWYLLIRRLFWLSKLLLYCSTEKIHQLVRMLSWSSNP